MERKSKQMTPLTMSILQKYCEIYRWNLVGWYYKTTYTAQHITHMEMMWFYRCKPIEFRQKAFGKFSTIPPIQHTIHGIYIYCQHAISFRTPFKHDAFRLCAPAIYTEHKQYTHESKWQWPYFEIYRRIANRMKLYETIIFSLCQKNKSAQSLSIAMMCWLIVYMLSQ